MRQSRHPYFRIRNIRRQISTPVLNVCILLLFIGTFVFFATKSLDEAQQTQIISYRSPHRHNDLFQSITQKRSSYKESEVKIKTSKSLQKTLTETPKKEHVTKTQINSSGTTIFNQTLVNWQDRWQRCNHPSSSNKLLVYSAYWDDRTESRAIRVIGVALTKKSPLVVCIVQYKDGTIVTVDAQKKLMKEHWNLKYSGYFFSCDVRKNDDVPISVKIGDRKDLSSTAYLPIHWNKVDAVSPRGDIALCVKPLHYSYNRAVWLVEFIELYLLLGVNHFYFYNHSVGRDVEKVLENYIRKNIVTVLTWNLDIRSQKEIRTEGIFPSLNNCIYKTMFLFKYVVMVDLDEYIIPKVHDNYTSLLKELEVKNRKTKGSPGSFVFRNTFFYLYWENDTQIYGAPPELPPNYLPYLLTQYKTKRLSIAMKYGSRSKFIVMPEKAFEVGNHMVWKHLLNSFPVFVSEKLALLHHYRICEFGGFDCMKKPFVIDKSAQRFNSTLLKNVIRRCGEIFGDYCPPSPPLGSPW